MLDRIRRDLSPEDIARVADTYHACSGQATNSPLPAGEGQGEGYADELGSCKNATLEEIRKHGYVLIPGHYVGAPPPQEDDGEPFEEKMARLSKQWRDQQAEARRLDAAIEGNLAKLGFNQNGEEAMKQPVSVQPRPGYRIWIEFSDGVSGEIDLSDVVGRGVFEAWNAPGYFDRVHIAPHRSIAWDDVELCPDALYMEITSDPFTRLPAWSTRPRPMPEICRFYGIVIRMYAREHAPPHFHAMYEDNEVSVGIDGLAVLDGGLGPESMRLVGEWASLHQDELMAAWDRALRMVPPGKIAPLE